MRVGELYKNTLKGGETEQRGGATKILKRGQNGPADSVVPFKICLGLKCKHLAMTLTLKVVSATFLLVYLLYLKVSIVKQGK